MSAANKKATGNEDLVVGLGCDGLVDRSIPAA